METILYIGGPCFMAEARLCIVEAHGVQVFPPSSGWYQGVKFQQKTVKNFLFKLKSELRESFAFKELLNKYFFFIPLGYSFRSK